MTKIGYVSAAIFGVVFLLFSSMPPPVAATGGVFHAGYNYCTPSGSSCSTDSGVQGYIYTIKPYVPYFADLSEWVTTIFSYSTGSYVQSGYAQCGGLSRCYTHTDPTYYCEYWTGSSDNLLWFGNPSAGSTHWYQAIYQGSNNWLCNNDSSSGHTWNTPYTYGVDYQAYSETKDNCIVITNTHLSSLAYYNTGFGFFLWNHHSYLVDSPYSLNQVSNSEFKASGGSGC